MLDFFIDVFKHGAKIVMACGACGATVATDDATVEAQNTQDGTVDGVVTIAYDYDENDRLLQETQTIEAIDAMRRSKELNQRAVFARWSSNGLNSFLVVSALLTCCIAVNFCSRRRSRHQRSFERRSPPRCRP